LNFRVDHQKRLSGAERGDLWKQRCDAPRPKSPLSAAPLCAPEARKVQLLLALRGRTREEARQQVRLAAARLFAACDERRRRGKL
jgi:hypothetical protein